MTLGAMSMVFRGVMAVVSDHRPARSVSAFSGSRTAGISSDSLSRGPGRVLAAARRHARCFTHSYDIASRNPIYDLAVFLGFQSFR